MSQIMRQLRIRSTVIPFIFMGAMLQGNAGMAKAANQEPPDVTAGDRLAHNLCINCHMVDASGPVARTDRVPSFPWIANQTGETATSITVWLSIKHERMPNFMLTDDQIRQLSAYIMSLRK